MKKLPKPYWFVGAVALLFCSMTSFSVAMVEGVEDPAVQTAFQEALRDGTKEKIAQFVQDFNITFNTRCIQYQITPRGDYQWAYPLEYTILYCGFPAYFLKKRLEILLDLGVSLNEYKDYNPLIHTLGSRSFDNIPVLLQLGANPNKKISYNKQLVTPLEVLEERMKTATDKEEYQKIRNLFFNPPKIEQKTTQSKLSVTQTSKHPVSPTFSKLMEEASAKSAPDDDNDKKNQHIHVLTYQQAALIASVAFAAGILCTKFIDWYMHSDQEMPDHQTTEQEN